MCSTSGSCIFAKPDVPVVLASRILHARLILAKSHPPFRVVSECLGWREEDGSGNFLPLNRWVRGAYQLTGVNPIFKTDVDSRIQKNTLLPQRGATGDNKTCQKFQPLQSIL